MNLPVPLIIDIIEILFRMQHESERHQREADFRRHIAQLQSSYALAKLQAEKEIIHHVLDLAKHGYDRKMDFLTEAFHSLQATIDRHQQALLGEQEGLTNSRFDFSLDSDERLRLERRWNQVSSTLITLHIFNQRLTYQFTALAASLDPLS